MLNLLQQKLVEMEAKLADKDKIQAILQDQIVKLAGQNIQTIHTAIEEVTKPKVEEPVAPSSQDSQSAAPVVDMKQAEPVAATQPTVVALQAPKEPETLAEPAKSNPSSENEWVQQEDDYGRIYFFNPATGQSSWEDPTKASQTVPETSVKEESTKEPQPVLKGDWLQQFDELGREYWVNQVTGQSEWVIPEDTVTYGAQADDEDEPMSMNPRGSPSIFDTNASQYSATAGDYTIEL